MDRNPWNINIQTERFQKYPPYTLFIVINVYMMKALPVTNLTVFISAKIRGVGQNFN